MVSMTKSLNSYDAGKAWVWGFVVTMLMTGQLRGLSRLLSVVPEILIALYIIWRRSVSVKETFRLRPIRPSGLLFPACFAISLGCLETLLLEGADFLAGGRLGDVAELVSPDLPGDTLLATMAFAVVFVPIAEELLFRGFFMTSMAELGMGWAIMVPSLLFALGHSPFGWAGAFIMAVAGSIFVLETGSILPGIAAHASANLLGTALPLIHDVLPGKTGEVVCILLRLAGVSLAFLFIPQYKTLWTSVRRYWSDFHDQPLKANLGYLLKHWSYKVIVAMLVASICLYGVLIYTGRAVTFD